MGSLTVREKVVPLDVPISKFGNYTPADGSQFSIAGVTLGGNPTPSNPVQDAFGRGQFQQLSDNAKLPAPACEQFDCGGKIGHPSVQGGHIAVRSVSMQWRIVTE